MSESVVIRDEPGEYRVTARYRKDGSFSVSGESSRSLTLTVRVEDVWERIAPALRRFSYSVEIIRDSGAAERRDNLSAVAPDARIFLDFNRSFRMEFS